MKEKDYYGAIKGFCMKWNLPEVWNSDRITGANLIYEVIKVINAMILEQKAMKEMIEEFILMFNEDLSDTVKDQLIVWLNDGTLGNLVNDMLFNSKLDKSEFEAFKTIQESVNSSLENTKLDKSVFNNALRDIEIKRKEIIYNVLEGGLVGDNLFVNDNALKVIIDNGYKNILFPSGTYYFEETPFLNDINVYAHENVLISLPHNWSQVRLFDMVLHDKIKVRSRDRLGNDVDVDSNRFNVLDKIMSSNDNNSQYDLSPTLLQPWWYGNDVQTPSNDNVNYNASTDKYTQIADRITFYTREADNDNLSLEALVNNNGSSSVGVMAMNKETNELMTVFLGVSKDYVAVAVLKDGDYGSLNNNKTVKHIKLHKSGSQWNTNTFKLMIKKNSRNSFTMFVNDVEIVNMKTAFNIYHIGFCSNKATNVIEKPLYSYTVQSPVNHPSNILIVGDSIGAGDGSSSDFKKVLKTMFESNRGMSNINVTSVTQGGKKIDQLRDLFNSTPLDNYDTVVIVGGTNDVINSSNATIMVQAIKDIVTRSRANNCRLIFTDIPQMTNYLDTGTGVEYNGSSSLPSYQHFLKHTVAISRLPLNDLAIANVSYETGTPFTIPSKLILEDNVHLTQRGQYALAKSIVKAYNSFTGS